MDQAGTNMIKKLNFLELATEDFKSKLFYGVKSSFLPTNVFFLLILSPSNFLFYLLNSTGKFILHHLQENGPINFE